MTPPSPVAAILGALERHGVRYVLIGGVAAQLHGWTEPTADIDVTPEPGDENLRRLALALAELDVRWRTTDGARPLAGLLGPTAIRRASALAFTCSHGNLDIALYPDGVAGFPELDADASDAALPSDPALVVRVASAAHIVRSKRAAGRVKDEAQLPRMIAVFRASGALPDDWP